MKSVYYIAYLSSIYRGLIKYKGTLLKWRVPFARIGVLVVCQLIELEL